MPNVSWRYPNNMRHTSRVCNEAWSVHSLGSTGNELLWYQIVTTQFLVRHDHTRNWVLPTCQPNYYLLFIIWAWFVVKSIVSPLPRLYWERTALIPNCNDPISVRLGHTRNWVLPICHPNYYLLFIICAWFVVKSLVNLWGGFFFENVSINRGNHS